MHARVKILFLLLALFVTAPSLCASAHPQDEGLGAALARGIAPPEMCEVILTGARMKESVSALRADAKECFPECTHLQSRHIATFEESLAHQIEVHPNLHAVHLEVMVDEKVFKKALMRQLHGPKGQPTLTELGLNVEAFASLIQHEDFFQALKKCATLSRLHLYNIITQLDEGHVLRLLKAFESLPQVRHLGLFDVSKDHEHPVEMRFTLPMIQGLSARGYETLTLDTLNIGGYEEAFTAFFLGRTRPHTLKIRGNIYCHLSGYSGLIQAIYAPHGVRIESAGSFFIYIEATKKYTKVMG